MLQAEALAKNIQSRLGEVAVSVGQAVSRCEKKLLIVRERQVLFLQAGEVGHPAARPHRVRPARAGKKMVGAAGS